MSELQVKAIQTSVYRVGDDFEAWLTESITGSELPEDSIVAITSKVISLSENRRVSCTGTDKRELIYREADQILGPLDYGSYLTITRGVLFASAGIDESNAEGEHYILLPQAPYASARKAWLILRRKFGLQNVGVILTDSRTSALRRGVTGVALAHWGFRGCKNSIGKKDLFGRELKMTQVNIADALAAAAVLVMGEGDECCPLAILKHSNAEFSELTDAEELKVPLRQDLYRPFLTEKPNR